jgi:hypothetical protein
MRTVVVVGCDGVEEIREGRDSGYDVSGAARGVWRSRGGNKHKYEFFSQTMRR